MECMKAGGAAPAPNKGREREVRMMDEDEPIGSPQPTRTADQAPSQYLNMGTLIAFGAMFGMVFGIFFKSIAMGLMLGAALGVVVGAIVEGQRTAR